MEKVNLSDICESITDGSHNPPSGVEQSNYIMLSSKNVFDDSITFDSPRYLSQSDYESENKRTKIKEGDVLLTIVGTVGRCAVVEKNTENITLQRSVAVLHPDSSKCVSRYLMYLLRSKKTYFENESRGVAQKGIYLKQLASTKVIVPEVDKQTEVVGILDRIQFIINSRKDQLIELDNLIKSRFVEMFGNPQSNPYNWLKVPMGKYMSTLTDFSANGSYEYLDSNVVMYDEPNFALMVRTTDLEKQDFETDVKYIDETAYNILGKSKIFGNEIIMNKIGSAGKVYLMPCLNRPVSLGRNAFMFRYNEEIDVIFIFHLLTSEYGTKEIMQHVRGAVTKTITKDAARSVKIIVPPINLQKQFATFVQQVDKLKVEVQKSLEETQTLFNGLMQKYFE